MLKGYLSSKIEQKTDRIRELEERLKSLQSSPKYVLIKEAASGKFGLAAQRQASTDLAAISSAIAEIKRQIEDSKRELEAAKEEVDEL